MDEPLCAMLEHKYRDNPNVQTESECACAYGCADNVKGLTTDGA